MLNSKAGNPHISAISFSTLKAKIATEIICLNLKLILY